MDGTREVARGFVITRGNGAALLEPGEEVLDQVARLVQMAVIAALVPARGFWRNHHGLAGLQQRLDYPGLCVVGLVRDDATRLGALEQNVCAFQVMGLSGGEVKAGWVAQRIDRGVDLGRQAATAAPDGLAVFRSPFLAPALCWWALTRVESIKTYSLSASCARASKTRCHAPHLLQREWRRCTTQKSPKRSGKNLARRCLCGSGTVPPRQTAGCPALSRPHVLRARAASP